MTNEFLPSQPWISTGKGWTGAALLPPTLSHHTLLFPPHDGQDVALDLSFVLSNWSSEFSCPLSIISSTPKSKQLFSSCARWKHSQIQSKISNPVLFPIPHKGKNSWKEWEGEGFLKLRIDAAQEWLVGCYWLVLLSIPNRNKSSTITQHWDLRMVYY